MSALTLLPAVDIVGGQAVQLVQGDSNNERRYGDPITAARRWQDQGAQWLHIVDLDAAFGRGDNAEVLSSLVAAVDINVELSGGIGDDVSLERALRSGAQRVNIGTAAIENPQWCASVIARYGPRIAIGLDVRNGQLAARGWTREGGDLFPVLAQLETAGCQRYVVTDITSDGMLSGPNLQLLREVCARTDKPVVASGGISSLADLAAVAQLRRDGVEGAIVGTALYEKRFSVTDALRVLEAA